MPSVEDAMLRESGRLMQDIGVRQSVHTPITALTPKAFWRDGMGTTHTAVLFQRGAITGGSGWQAVGVNTTAELNSCNPDPSIVNHPSQLFPYQLYQRSIASSYLCLNDLRSAFEAEEQVNNLSNQVEERVIDAWGDLDRSTYVDNSRHKMVFYQGTLVDQENSFATVAPDSTATPGLMANVYNRIIQDGGSRAFTSALGRADGQYVFPAIMSAEQAAFLDTSTGQRNDIRWNDARVGDLLEPWITTRVRNGFAYTIDPRVPRWDFNGGVWTEVPFYTTASASSGGSMFIVNPAYETALYEDIIIFMKDVHTREMPTPTFNAGRAKFDAQNYGGEVRWLNIASQDQNPLGNTGRFYALLQAAYRPKNPYLGYVIRVRRCPFNIEKSTCSGS